MQDVKLLTPAQGEALVRYARKIIESHFGAPKPEIPEILKEIFAENRGVFVTLSRYPGHELRGCIGYPEPTLPLGLAVERAALSSALEDPRFPRLKAYELDQVVVEVSVLTKPELIEVNNPREYPKKIKVGRDGLIVEQGFYRGLLLPQVPVEWGWDVEEFLAHTCMKAGLTPDQWLNPATKLYRFTAQIFAEKEPHGEIEEKKLGG